MKRQLTSMIMAGALLLYSAAATLAEEVPADPANATAVAQAAEGGAEQMVENLKVELAVSAKEAARYRRDFESLKKDYEGWKALNSKIFEVKSNNDLLVTENELLKKEGARLKSEYEKTVSQKNLYLFFSGAGVLLIGLLVGLLLGGAKRRSSHSGYRF